MVVYEKIYLEEVMHLTQNNTATYQPTYFVVGNL